MAYGSVNVPGVNHQELDAVRTATQAAQRTADEAKAAAQKAQGTADGAKTAAVVMQAATGSAAGTPGLVPAPGAGAQNKYLRGDGTWQTPPDTNTVYTHPTTSGNKHIPSGGSSGQILRWSADGTAVWGADNNTTYAAATQSANGLMSAADKKKLDGVTAGANAYSLPVAAAGTRGGIKIGYTANGKKYPVQLSNEQAFVEVPWTDTNTTYNTATQSANGLMSAADKKKLDGIATGASAPFVAQSSAPSNTKTLWIDTTAGTGGLKYHNGSAWVPVPVAYQ